MFVVRIVLVLYSILRRQRAGLISIAPLVPGKGDSPPDLRVSSSKFCSCRNYLLQGQLTFAFFYNYYIHLNSCCNFCFTNAKVTLTTSKLSHALPSPYPPPHHHQHHHPPPPPSSSSSSLSTSPSSSLLPGDNVPPLWGSVQYWEGTWSASGPFIVYYYYLLILYTIIIYYSYYCYLLLLFSIDDYDCEGARSASGPLLLCSVRLGCYLIITIPIKIPFAIDFLILMTVILPSKNDFHN